MWSHRYDFLSIDKTGNGWSETSLGFIEKLTVGNSYRAMQVIEIRRIPQFDLNILIKPVPGHHLCMSWGVQPMFKSRRFWGV